MIVIDKNERMSLMGRDMMNKLGIFVEGINELQIVDCGINNLIEKYREVFDNKLGKYNGQKIHLNLKENINPIFRKPHTIPLVFKDKVGRALQELEEDDIIEKVSTCEWGTPLVPALKTDNTIRVCANYKITVNKYLVDHNYPIPRIEEIFAALQEGEEFTTIDLDRAYNQLELDEETKRLLAWSTHKGVYLMK